MPALRNEDIYEAALDPEAFSRLPEMIAAECGGRSSVISWFHPDGVPEVLNYSYFSGDMMKQYVDSFTQHDVWGVVAMAKKNLNRVLIASDEITDADFARSTLFNEFFRSNGDDTFHCVGGVQVTPWGTAMIGVHKNRRSGAFEEQDRSRLAGITGHLRAALALRGRLVVERRAADIQRGAWDGTSLASIVVRRNGRMMQQNGAAEAVLRRADCLSGAQGTLRALSHAQNARLTRAVEAATAAKDPCGSSLLFETPGGASYLLSVAPLSRRAGASLALVLFKDPLSPSDPLRRQLQQLWGLTPHEAYVAAELSHGRSIAEIARARGVGESTVKTQLKAISAKMGVHGQAALIARISQIV